MYFCIKQQLKGLTKKEYLENYVILLRICITQVYTQMCLLLTSVYYDVSYSFRAQCLISSTAGLLFHPDREYVSVHHIFVPLLLVIMFWTKKMNFFCLCVMPRNRRFLNETIPVCQTVLHRRARPFGLSFTLQKLLAAHSIEAFSHTRAVCLGRK